MNKIIGISGLAGDGKDSLFFLLKSFFEWNSKYRAKRIALADKLKEECRPALLDLYGIDILSCSREEKERVRDMMVFHGKMKRIETSGKYWTSLVEKEISESNCKDTIFCIPDIRYSNYFGDEVDWIKRNHGTLIHVKKFKRNPLSLGQFLLSDKVYTTPVNEEERKNTPKVEKLADYVIEWQDCYPQKPQDNEYCVSCADFIGRKILESLD